MHFLKLTDHHGRVCFVNLAHVTYIAEVDIATGAITLHLTHGEVTVNGGEAIRVKHVFARYMSETRKTAA
jgi:hypothetical protein